MYGNKIATHLKIFVISLAVIAGSFVVHSSFAQAQERYFPFGGIVIGAVPASPVCPAHAIIIDFTNPITPLLGVAYLPLKTTLYSNFDMFTTGAFLLGDYDPTEPLFCPVPYIVVPTHQVGTS